MVLFLAGSAFASVPCKQIESEPDAWVTGRVNALVLAARRAYESDRAQAAYGRTLDGIARAMEQCRLADDSAFVKRYPEFVGYIKTLSLERQPDHELGFNVPDSVYFSETRAYVTIPDFLLTPNFLRAVSRFATLRQAKAMLEEINAGRPVDDQIRGSRRSKTTTEFPARSSRNWNTGAAGWPDTRTRETRPSGCKHQCRPAEKS